MLEFNAELRHLILKLWIKRRANNDASNIAAHKTNESLNRVVKFHIASLLRYMHLWIAQATDALMQRQKMLKTDYIFGSNKAKVLMFVAFDRHFDK